MDVLWHSTESLRLYFVRKTYKTKRREKKTKSIPVNTNFQRNNVIIKAKLVNWPRVLWCFRARAPVILTNVNCIFQRNYKLPIYRLFYKQTFSTMKNMCASTLSGLSKAIWCMCSVRIIPFNRCRVVGFLHI